jgi:CRISPR-associated protein Cas1
VGTLLLWIGDCGVRLYAAGQPGGARADKLLYQASLALDKETRVKVARAMYAFRFHENNLEKYSIEQLRGMEGARVRAIYKQLSKVYNIEWTGRSYDHKNAEKANCSNRCFSSATACLYGICEAAILAAGYSPTIGFIHYGKARSFVFDIADLFKFETVLPVAFKVASKTPKDPEGEVRRACRDSFRETRLLKKIIPTIEEILASGGLPVPDISEDMISPAFEEENDFGDPGHRG